MFLEGELRQDAKNTNFYNSKSAIYSKSGRMPLRNQLFGKGLLNFVQELNVLFKQNKFTTACCQQEIECFI